MTLAQPVDILAIGAHPDDQELSCGGTLLKMQAQGKSIGLLDLTRGEMGTRGTPETRRQEALAAARFVQARFRVGLDLSDGFLKQGQASIIQVIEIIRAARPQIVLANAIHDRHTDHAKGASLVHEAVFLSGLRNIKTHYQDESQEAFRPPQLYHYIQDRYIKPDFVIDIEGYLDTKMELVLQYRSQFYQSGMEGPQTPISGPDFLDFLRGRASEMGRAAGFKYGEGYTTSRTLGLQDFDGLV